MNVSAISAAQLYPVLGSVNPASGFDNAVDNNRNSNGQGGAVPQRAPRNVPSTAAPAPAASHAHGQEKPSTYLTLDTSSYADLTSWGWETAA